MDQMAQLMDDDVFEQIIRQESCTKIDGYDTAFAATPPASFLAPDDQLCGCQTGKALDDIHGLLSGLVAQGSDLVCT